MPVYEYRCPDCTARFEVRRSISQIDAPTQCPTCAGANSTRQISLPMFLTRTEDGGLSAITGGSPCGSCVLTSCSGCAVSR
jgi:putative FmdB family regulatory protein